MFLDLQTSVSSFEVDALPLSDLLFSGIPYRLNNCSKKLYRFTFYYVCRFGTFLQLADYHVSNPTLWVGFEELCVVEGKLFSSFLLITAINKFFS